MSPSCVNAINCKIAINATWCSMSLTKIKIVKQEWLDYIIVQPCVPIHDKLTHCSILTILDWVNWTCGHSSCTGYLWSWLMGPQIPGGVPGPRAAEVLSKVAGGDLNELQRSEEQRYRADPIHDLKEDVPVPGFLCGMGSETVHHVWARRSVRASIRGCDLQHAEHQQETDFNDGSLQQLEHARLTGTVVLDSTLSKIFQDHGIVSAVVLRTPAHRLTLFTIAN